MLNKILISCVISLLVITVRADELTINPDNPGKYTVVKGDTLWDISTRFLDQPWRWPEIWQINPQIADPHLIYPGDIVSLSYKDGKPVLGVERGNAQIVFDRNVKLSPTIRSSDNEEAIHTIPIDAIQQFLQRSLVLDDNEIDKWPYVVSSYDKHLIATVGNTIYVKGIPEDSNVSQYSIYRKGSAYIKPKKDKDEEKQILGYEAIYVGDATLQKNGDPASALITVVDREVLIGDRLLPQSNENISAEFIPKSMDSEVEGNILSVVDGVSQIGQYQIIVLSLGEEQGVEPGTILGIYQSGYVVQDRIASQDKVEYITLPEEYVGVAMVFRTFNKVSYALVMKTRGSIHVLDTVRNL